MAGQVVAILNKMTKRVLLSKTLKEVRKPCGYLKGRPRKEREQSEVSAWRWRCKEVSRLGEC